MRHGAASQSMAVLLALHGALAVLLGGCSKKSEDPPAPVPAVEKVAPEPLPSAVAPVPRAPAYRLVHTFPKPVTFYGLKKAIIACEGDCSVPRSNDHKAPGIWLVTAEKIEEDASLWPEKAYNLPYSPPIRRSELAARNGSSKTIFWGEYPEDLWTVIEIPYDRGDWIPPSLKRSGKIWLHSESKQPRLHEPSSPPPRDLDDARLHAPFLAGISHGAGGPVVMVDTGKLATWTGETWRIKEAPWTSPRAARRLDTGATLVIAQNGIFVLDAKGEVAPIALKGELALDNIKKPDYELLPLDERAWIGVNHEGGAVLLAPLEPKELTLAKVPVRISRKEALAARKAKEDEEAKKAAEAERAAQADSEDAGAASEDAGTAKKAEELPAPGNFHAACTTPFVMIATPPHPGWDYKSTCEGIRGHGELQDELSFIEFVRHGQTYFGAQAKSEDAARKLMAVITANIPGMKPQLGCYDALTRIPDRYSPPKNIRIVFINMATGLQLDLW